MRFVGVVFVCIVLFAPASSAQSPINGAADRKRATATRVANGSIRIDGRLDDEAWQKATPGIGAIANVCGTCHSVFATKFALSTHSQIFERGCVECHGNHEIAKPADAMLGTDKTALCGNCHNEGDNGHKAATAMRSEIEKLKDAIARSQALVASAENAGMEMGDQSLALREAGNHLTLARTEMHAFDPKAVLTVLQEGLGITSKVDAEGQAALAEVSFRKTGLAVSLGAILLVVVALSLKIRGLKSGG